MRGKVPFISPRRCWKSSRRPDVEALFFSRLSCTFFISALRPATSALSFSYFSASVIAHPYGHLVVNGICKSKKSIRNDLLSEKPDSDFSV
jgi:hypothetical protein